MTRVLMVHPSLQPPGGGNCVAAWAIEALREPYDLTLLAWRQPDLEPVNRYFGTSLRPGDFRLLRVPAPLRLAVDSLPTPSALLGWGVMTRYARRLLQRGEWDVVLSTQNEMDFGRPGIQYIHFPTYFEPRPDCDHRWYHRAFPFLLSGYRRLSHRLASHSADGIRRNLSLVNSDWTGGKLREIYGVDSVTVPPPVPGTFLRRPWEEREDGFVCIGRISPEKEVVKMIEILSHVRRRGRAIRFHIVGSPDHDAYTQRVLTAAEAEGDWIDLHFDLPRDEMLTLLAASRYGIHGMGNEHFGIAVAEMQRAGAIVFVPDDGGQVEIVDGDPRLVYRSVEEAVEKIDRVLTEPDLRGAILRNVEERRGRYSAERFVADLRGAVGDLSEMSKFQ
ncbi:MAG: glycosyltransferase [Acidobacteriota bacterium]